MQGTSRKAYAALPGPLVTPPDQASTWLPLVHIVIGNAWNYSEPDRQTSTVFKNMFSKLGKSDPALAFCNKAGRCCELTFKIQDIVHPD